MEIQAYFDPQTFTLTYLVFDPKTNDAVIIDPVLDFDAASGTTAEAAIEQVLVKVTKRGLRLRMVLETHAHADHLSASQVIKRHHPEASLAVSERIRLVQAVFKDVFDLGEAFPTDGSQFDRLLQDGEVVRAGSLTFKVIPTPGHTPACSSYLFEGAVFTGDALFMPDYGTGRCDFPSGSAKCLFQSITGGLYSLPESTRVYTGHDYQPGGRPLRYESTIGEERRTNIQLSAATSEVAFVALREGRDAKLTAPKLLYPSVQVNIAGGHLPMPAANGVRYLKIPLNFGRVS